MSSTAVKARSTLAAFAGAGLGFAGALAWLWPRMVAVRGDDFGYLESAVLTIQRGRPVSSDWLEPFNLVLPSLSATGWWLTGNFYLSTVGLLGLVAAGIFVLGWFWLRPMLPAGWPGHLSFLALALCPVWLNKASEYTGVSLGLLFFLGALLAWRHARPALFYSLVCLAVLNRQSAVCLLALPAWSWWSGERRGERAERGWIWGLIAALAIVAMVVALQPENIARSLAAQRVAQRNWTTVIGQALLGLVLLGGIAAFWSLLRGAPAGGARRRADAAAAAGWLAAGALLSQASVTLQCETPLLGRSAPFLVLGASLLAALVPRALWQVRPAALAAAGFYATLVAWRGIWWDYYLLELTLLLACCRETPPPASSRWHTGAIGALLFLAMLPGLPPVRFQVRWAEHAVFNYESLLRGHRIGIREASEAPFGLLGWKLFPVASRAPERMTGLTDFLGYVEVGRSRLAGEGVLLFPSVEPIRSLHPSGRLRPLPADYRDRRFPLDNAEWRDLLGTQAP